MSEGLTVVEIATVLGLSTAMVRTHIHNSMHALDARTRVHAVVLGLGLAQVEPAGAT
jgi:DNA-binding CsgD family transcriptional regulator